MNELTPRFWEVFFEALPRQGPGNRACAARALGLCSGLPPSPAVLDLGCGIGGQTPHLAEFFSMLTGGRNAFRLSPGQAAAQISEPVPLSLLPRYSVAS